MDVHNDPNATPARQIISRGQDLGRPCSVKAAVGARPSFHRPSGGTRVPQRHLGRISVVRRLAIGAGVAALLLATAACTGATEEPVNPDLLPRGTTLTTAKPTRQNLTSRLSLSGKVTLNPIYGIVAPIAGQVRYLDVPTAAGIADEADQGRQHLRRFEGHQGGGARRLHVLQAAGR